MSIWNEGRYANNITWITQLLEKGGVKELTEWLVDQPEVVQDDILLMMNQLVLHLAEETETSPNYQPLEEESDIILDKWVSEIAENVSKVPKKPHLYIVKNDEKS